jgi:hypothetical protein
MHASRNFALLLAGSSLLALAAQSHAALAAKGLQVQHNSLMVSTTSYDKTQGAIATLTPGVTILAKSASATTTAIADNNFVNTWNNSSVDGAFSVTAPITLLNVNAGSGTIRHTIAVPSSQVVGSFSSKSEGGLHVTTDASGLHVVFMGYGKAGVGALDVSNSDAVAGQDPSNPVTFAFGSSYTFPRTIVSMDQMGNFKYTPTIAYGGDNPRNALLGSNGLYYTVGNSNNGNASTFGAGNGTNPDVTTTTGLEAVNPIDGSSAFVAIPANNSAEVNAGLQFTVNGKLDKAGKDTNFRGIAEFGGALYFTKGSGSNGVDTVYTVPGLPTVANAGATAISIVPGFPTDFAKVSGGDYTPFGIFFADANTLYVADEGAGNSTDQLNHAGLQKWSKVNGTWQLDYVLRNGAIGLVDTNLNGPDGQYPDVTTTGLRNLTGRVGANGVVTLWATTATTSASPDVGANPNRVVKITDVLAATTITKQVAKQTFKTILGPKYGTVYHGVAYVP